MYEASNAFHTAVRNNNAHQICMLIFEDCIFTNEDIDVDAGIEFHDDFNLKEDISIGQTISNEISFSIFNDSGYLNDYEFGEFEALLGVQVAKDTYRKIGASYAITQYATYVGNSKYPFLTRNGIPVSPQPSFAVNTIIAYDKKVYAFNGDGRYAVYDDSTGANATGSVPVSTFFAHKAKNFQGVGMFYNKDSRIMFRYKDGERSRYEFVPLGKFSALRPDVPSRIYIDFTCHDFMQKFDIEMPASEALGIEYPTTVGGILQKCCDYVKVENGETGTFINSGLEVAEEPEVFSKCTMREVIGWIAEAACANAKIDRDGKLRLRWLTGTSQMLDEHHYTEFQPFWYESGRVDRVLNRDTANAADDVNGAGRNGYLIQDNPFLRVKSTEPEEEQPWEKAQEWVEELKNEKYIDVEIQGGGRIVG